MHDWWPVLSLPIWGHGVVSLWLVICSWPACVLICGKFFLPHFRTLCLMTLRKVGYRTGIKVYLFRIVFKSHFIPVKLLGPHPQRAMILFSAIYLWVELSLRTMGFSGTYWDFRSKGLRTDTEMMNGISQPSHAACQHWWPTLVLALEEKWI